MATVYKTFRYVKKRRASSFRLPLFIVIVQDDVTVLTPSCAVLGYNVSFSQTYLSLNCVGQRFFFCNVKIFMAQSVEELNLRLKFARLRVTSSVREISK